MKQRKEEEFIEKVKNIFEKNSQAVIDNLKKDTPKTFRLSSYNLNEKSILTSLKSEGFEIKESVIKNFFININSQNGIKLSESSEYLSGNIYIQELSSSLPVVILEPDKNDVILDLCAAPGSKTSQLAINFPSIKIFANEKNRNRFFKMKEIIEKQNLKNVKTILSDANYLPGRYPEFIEYFDKIILDAPCSNEASINLNKPSTLKYWNRSQSKSISKLQKGLINTALKLLKPGGTLIYSTCTFSVEENELVIDWILNKNSNLKIEKIDLDIPNKMDGLIKWKEKELNPQIINTKRIIPDGYFKGFFLAKLIKEK